MFESLLHKEIQERGPLSQGRFMELALQHPLYGYYRSQEAISRDFTTSPEISQLFGDVIGAWVLDYYTKLKQPKALSLLELGPGKGTLMADILRIGKLSPPFLKALKVHLVEINPLLKEAQRKIIQNPATWVEKFEMVPSMIL
jgi:NADH dehydrogenase [ubiquinone] 1 alpha subcomplex assembly factor 7